MVKHLVLWELFSRSMIKSHWIVCCDSLHFMLSAGENTVYFCDVLYQICNIVWKTFFVLAPSRFWNSQSRILSHYHRHSQNPTSNLGPTFLRYSQMQLCTERRLVALTTWTVNLMQLVGVVMFVCFFVLKTSEPQTVTWDFTRETIEENGRKTTMYHRTRKVSSVGVDRARKKTSYVTFFSFLFFLIVPKEKTTWEISPTPTTPKTTAA